MSISVETLETEAENMRRLSRESDYSTRIKALKGLKKAIKDNEDKILAAIKADFNKPEFDSYITEIGICYAEIDYFLKHLKGLMRPRSVRTGINTFPSRGKIYAEPYGTVLVISPWNFPFQLAVAPLIGAIAAGNSVILKPASATRNTAEILDKIITEAFPDGRAAVFRGTRDDGEKLLAVRYDYIFFTGGTKAAHRIMSAAAKHLTPVSLELGGKSPCIIDESADIKVAAKRIAWAKFFNAGQVCVAPDYLLVHDRVYDGFMDEFLKNIKDMYYDGGVLKSDFPLLVNAEKGEEMRMLLDGADILFGGHIDGRKIEPTVVATDFDGPLMQNECFAPVAPIIRFDDFDAIAEKISAREKPLALYYFGKKSERAIKLSFGGGCVNDCIMHVGEGSLPFGGVGNSGMGRYHEKASFDTFSHYKSVLIKGKADLPIRYDKSEKNLGFVRKILK